MTRCGKGRRSNVENFLLEDPCDERGRDFFVESSHDEIYEEIVGGMAVERGTEMWEARKYK